ncbi:MAG TPA: S4 domain-containing protein, partial [Candidatus Acidoferrales bacterium]|nr:S4 domain-containing protein [Candidatus Acidoferrales bacterium]
MRIDKYLKVSRLAKRRGEAHEALVAGRITRGDGKALKPGYEVRAGDVLILHYARKVLTVRVLVVP